MQLLKPGKLVVGTLIGAMAFCRQLDCCGSRQAQEGRQETEGSRMQFAKLDKDNNKVLTVAEMVGSKTGKKEEHARAAFKKRDRDGDGKLSLASLPPKSRRKPSRRRPSNVTHLHAEPYLSVGVFVDADLLLDFGL